MIEKSEKSEKKSNGNHFNVGITKNRETLYREMKELSKELGCSMSHLVWYGLELVNENRPNSFGLAKVEEKKEEVTM